jgi:dihydrofolate reductase
VGKLVYSAITSLDGYVVDADGSFDWAAPDDEVHRYINAMERPIGTYLYGRRIYEVMTYWETAPTTGESAGHEYAAIWKSAAKVVYSSTLDAPTTARTRLERTFEADAVRQLTAESDADVSIGGRGLAAHALHAGLVHEVHQFVTPVVVGGGTHWLPSGLRLDLELLDEHRFVGGVVHLHYRAG